MYGFLFLFFCFIYLFIYFIFRIMYGFLIRHVIALLEFKKALKNFLDLKIYRIFIKQFDQIKRKSKKIQKRERDKENGKESQM